MKTALRAIVGAAAAVIFSLPLLWMVLASLRENSRVFQTTASAWLDGSGWTFHNYASAWQRSDLGHGLFISLFQVAAISGIGLIVNATAAYAFARLHFPGRDVLFALVVALIVLPLEALAVPLFFTVRDLGLTGGYAAALGGLTLPFFAKAFNIYFLRQHFLALPTELEEAAAIDGAGPWRQFWNVALPAIRPALATVVILDLLTHWGDFLWPLLITTRAETRTVQIGLANLFTQPPIQWGDILACATMATLPPLLIFRWLERHLVPTEARAGIK
jgi:ABC-type glycerol-3-phosphate transport system permease component